MRSNATLVNIKKVARVVNHSMTLLLELFDNLINFHYQKFSISILLKHDIFDLYENWNSLSISICSRADNKIALETSKHFKFEINFNFSANKLSKIITCLKDYLLD